MSYKYCTKEVKEKLTCDCETPKNPYIGCRVIVRTYSAGVHCGTLVSANGMECELHDGFRLWSWKDGGLSLSAISTNGIVSGRLNRTLKVYLTNAIEYIPYNEKCEKSFEKFVEDNK